MEQLGSYMLDKFDWKNILVLFLFLEIPSLILIFVWDKELFLMIDMIKLMLFSFAIGFMIFFPNYFCVNFITRLEKRDETENEKDENYILAIVATFTSISIAIVYKLCNSAFTIINFITYDALFLIIFVIYKTVRVAKKSIKSKN